MDCSLLIHCKRPKPLKTKKYDGNDVRRVLAAIVTDTTVCARVASQWLDEGLFTQGPANLVGGWCVRHVNEYGTCPNGNLQSIFEAWADKTPAPDETVEFIEKFLHYLSDEHSQQPPDSADYIIDLAATVFNRAKTQKTIEAASEELLRGDVGEAQARLANSTKVELGIGSLTKPAEDWDVWQAAFNIDHQEPLIKYPGGLGKFFGNSMTRGTLFSYMGPDKSGKSFWLLDGAFRAIKRRHRVAYFEVGDLGLDDTMIRMGSRAARMPHHPCTVDHYPVDFDENGDLVSKPRTYAETLTAQASFKAFKKASWNLDLFRLSTHANSSISAMGISSIVTDWAREGWVADCIILDYADILAPPAGVKDKLDQIDLTWKHLRRMSQETHTLVLTATQSSSLAYKTGSNASKVLTPEHFSGRKTKLAEVNGMIGINQTPEEKAKGITRLNWVNRRKGWYTTYNTVIAAGSLALACPSIKSHF